MYLCDFKDDSLDPKTGTLDRKKDGTLDKKKEGTLDRKKDKGKNKDKVREMKTTGKVGVSFTQPVLFYAMHPSHLYLCFLFLFYKCLLIDVIQNLTLC